MCKTINDRVDGLGIDVLLVNVQYALLFLNFSVHCHLLSSLSQTNIIQY